MRPPRAQLHRVAPVGGQRDRRDALSQGGRAVRSPSPSSDLPPGAGAGGSRIRLKDLERGPPPWGRGEPGAGGPRRVALAELRGGGGDGLEIARTARSATLTVAVPRSGRFEDPGPAGRTPPAQHPLRSPSWILGCASRRGRHPWADAPSRHAVSSLPRLRQARASSLGAPRREPRGATPDARRRSPEAGVRRNGPWPPRRRGPKVLCRVAGHAGVLRQHALLMLCPEPAAHPGGLRDAGAGTAAQRVTEYAAGVRRRAGTERLCGTMDGSYKRALDGWASRLAPARGAGRPAGRPLQGRK